MIASRASALLLGLALCLVCAPAAGQYSPGDVVVIDQRNIGQNWPIWGITSQGKIYTVTTLLPLGAYSIAPAPDNRSIWVSGKGNAGYTTSSVAPDGTIVNFNVDLQNLFSSIDVDGGGNAILGNLVRPEIKKYAGSSFTTLYTGSPITNIIGGGLDLYTGDLVVLDSAGIFQANLHGTVKLSTVIAPITRPRNGGSLHDDPDTGTLVGAWSNGSATAIYRLALGTPGILSTLWNGSTMETFGALDRDPFDGRYVIPAAASSVSSRPSAVYRFDARTSILTTLATFPGTLRASPMGATVAGSRHLCAGNEARPGQAYTLMVSSPNEPGAAYIIACSFGFGPGIPLGQGRKVYLSPDALFNYSLQNTGIFSGFQGLLGPKGEAIATLKIPNIPQLSGFRFFAAAVTINQNQISVISDTLGVTIQ